MSAGPQAIAEDATIVDYPPKAGQPLVQLRKGTNEWTCFPDWQVTPGEDPQCLDQMWMRWFEAISAGTEPNTTAPVWPTCSRVVAMPATLTPPC